MKIKVENCWAGGEKFNFRLTLPNGSRVLVPAPGGYWRREVAKRALDALEELGFERRTIQFVHT